MPMLSVIVPLYNNQPEIGRALNSIFTQTIQDFEIIVVDGHSTDGGLDVVKSIQDPRIHFFLQKGAGVSTARNQGVERAQADFIAFLDADDEWLPTHLEILLHLREKFPEGGAYSTAYSVTGSDGSVQYKNYRFIPSHPWEGAIADYFRVVSYGANPVWTSVAAIPKEIFIANGGFPTDAWWGEDEDLWGRIALKHPIIFSTEFSCIRHRANVSEETRRNRILKTKQHPFIKTAKRVMSTGSELQNRDLKNYVDFLEITNALNFLGVGDKLSSRSILKKINKFSLNWRNFEFYIYVDFCSLIPTFLYHSVAIPIYRRFFRGE